MQSTSPQRNSPIRSHCSKLAVDVPKPCLGREITSMEGLRKPFFYLAIALSVVIVLLELGKVTADSLIKTTAPTFSCSTVASDADTFSQCLSHQSDYQTLLENKDSRP